MLPKKRVANSLVGCVDCAKRVEVRRDRSKNDWWVDGRDGEVWLLGLDKLLRRPLSKGFASMVPLAGIRQGLLVRRDFNLPQSKYNQDGFLFHDL